MGLMGTLNGNGVNFILGINGNLYQGLFGYAGTNASISNLSVSGVIKGTEYVGSIVGYNLGAISNVFSTANVLGESVTGGLVGFNGGSLSGKVIS